MPAETELTKAEAGPRRPSRPLSSAPRERMDVRLERVTKQFGDAIAVDDLSLVIESGEFFSLLGSSGCGKTTTLSMIGGFQEPSSGAIYLGGVDVSHLPPYKRDVNTVFQSYALFPHLDVFENIAFGLRRKRVAKSEIESRVREVLRLVALTGFESRKPALLSGGQQQRVALARALVNRPKLLLLDEPLGALDLKLRKQMQIELKRIQSEVGITFLYVTHDQEEAIVMSDRLAVMANGKIEQVGPPDQVYDNPATEFVAGFLGASNLMWAERSAEAGAMTTVRLDGGRELRVRSDRLKGHGQRVRIGVRPEKIVVLPANENVSEGWNSFEGQIDLSVYTGIGHQYTVTDEHGHSFSAYVQNRDSAAAPSRGDKVRIAWLPEHTFVVTPTTTGKTRSELDE